MELRVKPLAAVEDHPQTNKKVKYFNATIVSRLQYYASKHPED